MCNACYFQCCANDNFSGCGCYPELCSVRECGYVCECEEYEIDCLDGYCRCREKKSNCMCLCHEEEKDDDWEEFIDQQSE